MRGVVGLLAGIGELAFLELVHLSLRDLLCPALGGAGLGATTGGVVGALIGMGIPEIEAKRASPFQKRRNGEGALQANDVSS